MKVTSKRITYLLLLLIIPLFTACDNEDDLVTIFTGKTWKLSRLTTPGSVAQFPQDFWQTEEAYNSSMQAFQGEKNYTLNFEGVELNGELSGTSVSGKGIKATLSGYWTANGKDNSFSISNIRINTTESDPLAKVYIAGLQTAYKYEGDANSLVLYFKYNNKDMIMGFTPKR
ncbi:MAG: DUF4847 family protein [Bacteroides sp.]|nr:DUF4847 family protein [Bacteroides sp.]MBQ8224296.1 DUF4847 family protein [Bacteroides sp.]